jgi:hypothetical protein
MNLGINQTGQNVFSADVDDFLSVRQRGVIAYSDKPAVFYRHPAFDNALRGNYLPILENEISAFRHFIFLPLADDNLG